MSTATELAEVEAQCAEAELSDKETAVVKGGVAAGVPVAEAIALVLEARAEATGGEHAGASGGGDLTTEQLEALDKAKATHLKAVRRVLGDLADELVECETCDGMGLAPPAGETVRPKAHEFFRACETCNALGQVLTGSLVAGNIARPCPDCKGRGYLEALDTTGAPLAGMAGSSSAPLSAVPTPGAEPTPGSELAAPGEPRFGAPAWMGDPAIGA